VRGGSTKSTLGQKTGSKTLQKHSRGVGLPIAQSVMRTGDDNGDSHWKELANVDHWRRIVYLPRQGCVWIFDTNPLEANVSARRQTTETTPGVSVISMAAVSERGSSPTYVARGESVIKCPSPLNVLKDADDRSCCLARSYEYNHLKTDSPWARLAFIVMLRRHEGEGRGEHRQLHRLRPR
jgi:hypothetical protein